jgi:hypothetical protein
VSGMDGARASRRSNAASVGATQSAQTRKCPRCLRKGAMGSRIRVDDGWSARVCRWCAHSTGIIDGKPFGYDVTPEPGARS